MEIVNSFGDDCNELKKQYDACFDNWFTEQFLRGKHDDSMVPCESIFKIYQECVKRGLKKQKIDFHEIDAEYRTGEHSKK